MATEEARLALEQLLQQKGEAEHGHLLLKSVYLLSQTDLVREMTTKGFFCFILFWFFYFLFQRIWVSHPNSGTPKSHNICVIPSALCFSLPRV